MNFDLEVTQLLLVASSGFVIPRERLKDRNNTLEPGHRPKRRAGGAIVANHPDVAAFLGLADTIHQEFKLPLKAGSFWALVQPSVQYQKLLRPAGVELSALGAIPDNMITERFFDILRNGLAHGNIFVKGDPNREIASLTFGQSVIRDSDDYEFVTLSVQDFRKLLLAWFALLLDEGLASGVKPTKQEATD
ncbi:hypothetical protein [Deinococcus aquaedulcis]|uniref:hypothetical protein n=1 Tax=Deinococcus aquaedulcis TaxID=2840455 RepID=UPI001C83AAEC|nr:hypothetical protein [Deinococcus aquaedulcis]